MRYFLMFAFFVSSFGVSHLLVNFKGQSQGKIEMANNIMPRQTYKARQTPARPPTNLPDASRSGGDSLPYRKGDRT